MAEALGVAVLELRTDNAPLARGLAQGEQMSRASMDRTEAMVGKRVASVGQNMSRLGNNWTRSVTLPIVGGAALAVKAAMDFESALTQVQTQAGASAGEIARMRGELLKLAPAVGQTPTELANALYHIESAGLRGAKALDVLRESAKLAAIGHSDLEQTASAVVAVMKSAPKDVRSATDAIGLLNATVGEGNLRLQDMVGALSTGLLPRAKAVGLGLRDVGAAIDVMTSRGVPAQAAATRLGMTFSLMAAPTHAAVKALGSVGLTQTQLASDMRKPDGLVVALRDLKSHMDKAGLSAIEQNQVISHAFGGGRSSSAVLMLIQNIGDLQKHFEDIGKHSGAKQVQSEWEKTQTDLKFKWNQLKATAQKDAIEIGTTVGPALLGVAGTIAKDAGAVASAFSKLPKGLQQAIITGGLITAAVGPALRIAGVFTTGIGRLYDAARIAERLATGKGFGLGGAASSVGKMSSTVGTMEVGTLIARNMIGGGGGVGGGGVGAASTVERDAAAAAASAEAAAKNMRRVTTGIAGGSALAIGGLAAASHAQGNPLNQLNAIAHGVDPTAVLHLVGLPAVSDLLPSVKKRMSLSATDIAALGMGIPPNLLPAFRRLSTGATGGTNPRGVHATAAGDVIPATPKQIEQETRDFGKMNDQLARLENHQQGVRATARALDQLSKSAFKLGDTQIGFADKVGAEMLRSRSVTSKGVLAVIGQLNKLGPAARTSAAQAMTGMAVSLEQQGRLPLGATVRFVGELLSNYKTVRDQGGVYFRGLLSDTRSVMDLLKTKIKNSTGQQRTEAVAQYNQLRSQVKNQFGRMESDTASKMTGLTKAITHGSHTAAVQAGGDLYNFAYNVEWAMTSGLLSAKDGARLIAKETAAAVKAFGGKPIPAVFAVGAATTNAAVDNAIGKIIQFKAGGGIVGSPGAAGADNIPIVVGEGEAVLNRHQQAPVEAALRHTYGMGLTDLFSRVSRPHYMAGGGFVSTAYGPPWGGIQGGGTTATGIDLHGSPHRYIIAVDPSVIPLHSQVKVWPNPFGYTGTFGAEDTGGAIKGNRIDFYDWKGRGDQDAWGVRNVIATILGRALAGSAAGVSQIHAPHVKGKGTIAEIVRGALAMDAKAANAYLSAHMPTGGGGGGTPGAQGPKGLGTFDGLQVADWIIPVLNWARSHGWGGHITSGFRPEAGSEHALTQWPGGAVDVGFNTAIAQGTALENVLKRYPGHPNLLWGGQYISGYTDPRGVTAPGGHDYGHFSGTGHARGGFVGRFAGGGMPLGHAASTRPAKSIPTNRKAAPKAKGKHPKAVAPLGGQTPWITWALNQLNGLLSDHGQTAKLQDRYTATDGLFQALHPNLQYVVTPPGGGAPYIDQNAVDLSLGELNELFGWETEMQADYQRADRMISGLLTRLKLAIRKRQQEIAKRQRQIRENLKRIAELEKRVKQSQGQATVAAGQIAGDKRSLRLRIAAEESKPPKQRNQTLLRSLHLELAVLDGQVAPKAQTSGLTAQINSLKDDNARLGGDRTKVGTGGEIGGLNKQLTSFGNQVQVVNTYHDDTVGVSGIGGNLNATNITLAGLSAQIGELSPDALKQTLTQAGGGTAATDTLALKDQQLTEARQELAVSDAQYKVLANLPPFGGSFAAGGIVPGPIGAARMVIAHGGEEYLGVHGDRAGTDVHLHFKPGTEWLRDFVDVRVEKRTRKQSRDGSRGLPGAGGARVRSIA